MTPHWTLHALLGFAWLNALTFERRAKACVLESPWARWRGVPVTKIGWFAYPVLSLAWLLAPPDWREVIRWGAAGGLFIASSRQAWGLRWIKDPCQACLSGHALNAIVVLGLVLGWFG